MKPSHLRLLAAQSIFAGAIVLMLGEIVRFLHILFVQQAFLSVKEIAPYYSTPGTTWGSRAFAGVCVIAAVYFWMLAKKAATRMTKSVE
jgi:hypothetical protein